MNKGHKSVAEILASYNDKAAVAGRLHHTRALVCGRAHCGA